jgi:hypothetical protein
VPLGVSSGSFGCLILLSSGPPDDQEKLAFIGIDINNDLWRAMLNPQMECSNASPGSLQ